MDLGTEAVDTGAGRLRRRRQLLDALHALAHHLLAGINLLVRRLGRLRRLFGITRHIVHSGGHLLHGGGHLLGLFLLAAHLAVGLLGHRRQRLRIAGQLLDALLQTADNARQARRHLLHGLHQLPYFVTPWCLGVKAQLAGSDALGAGNHMLERPDHGAGDQPGGQHTYQQRQCRSQADGHGIALQFALQGLLLPQVSLVDPAGDLFGTGLQLRLQALLAGQLVSVFVELFREAANVPRHFAQHTLVAGIADGALQLADQAGGLDGLGDAVLADALFTLAAFFQAYPRFIHGLQHQPRHLRHLPGLLEERAALLALGLLEGIHAVISQAGLQHIEVVGHAGHRPAGHVQRQLLGLHRFDKGLECLAVGGQVGFRRRQRRQATSAFGQALQAAAQGLGLLQVGAQGKGLLVLAQAQQVGIELGQLAQAVEALANTVQRGNANGRHRQGQHQHQGKAQAKFAGHAQVGQHTVLARAHRRFPFCVRGYPEGQGWQRCQPMNKGLASE
ncbi:hypothetical protein D3C79_469360 [compost metagenome]